MANVNYEEVTYQKKEASNPNYNIDKDAVWEKHETAQNVALNESNALYDDRVDTIDEYYQKQIENSQAWADKQTQLQNERTDFTIEQINQQKDQAKKDYTKEQSGAYVDWQKQSNQYGVNAEKMAGSGLTNTGYSESSQASMYNTYQNRISTAREVYNKAVINYDNAIKDAQLQNNSALAEIAFKAQEEQLQFVFESALQQNTLLIEKANKQQQIQEMYYSRYLNELDQLYKENALAEEIRQYNLNYNQKERENELANEQWKKEIELEREKLLQDQAQFDAQLLEEQRQFNLKNPLTGDSYNGSPIIKEDAPKEGEIKAPTGSEAVNDALESKLTVDTASLVQLGLGTLTAKELEDLIERGYVKDYVEGNKIKYRFVGTLADRNMLMAMKKKNQTPTTTTKTTTSGSSGKASGGNKTNLSFTNYAMK